MTDIKSELLKITANSEEELLQKLRATFENLTTSTGGTPDAVEFAIIDERTGQSKKISLEELAARMMKNPDMLKHVFRHEIEGLNETHARLLMEQQTRIDAQGDSAMFDFTELFHFDAEEYGPLGLDEDDARDNMALIVAENTYNMIEKSHRRHAREVPLQSQVAMKKIFTDAHLKHVVIGLLAVMAKQATTVHRHCHSGFDGLVKPISDMQSALLEVLSLKAQIEVAMKLQGLEHTRVKLLLDKLQVKADAVDKAFRDLKDD